jgi:2-C-methyl-D-erythritol 4-phosphate cytidylyltransferase
LGADGPKQYLALRGIPMLQRTLAALDSCDVVDALVVVVNPEDVDFCRREIVGGRFGKVIRVVGGGAERALSVRNGLEALAEESSAGFLGTHDGARPLVSCAMIRALIDQMAMDDTLDGAILAEAASDTTKLVDAEGVVVETPDRRRVWRAQTPQIFRRERLLAAYGRNDAVLGGATDDASLVEAGGGRVAVVAGSSENLKVTTPLDLRLAELILAEREGS